MAQPTGVSNWRRRRNTRCTHLLKEKKMSEYKKKKKVGRRTRCLFLIMQRDVLFNSRGSRKAPSYDNSSQRRPGYFATSPSARATDLQLIERRKARHTFVCIPRQLFTGSEFYLSGAMWSLDLDHDREPGSVFYLCAHFAFL